MHILQPRQREESQLGCTLHKRWGSLQHQPCLLIDEVEDEGPQESRGSTGRWQGCEDGATVEVDVSHVVGVPFSQKVTPIHPLHSLSMVSTSAVHFFLLCCSKKYDCLGKKTHTPFLAAECMKFQFTSEPLEKGGVWWEEQAHVSHTSTHSSAASCLIHLAEKDLLPEFQTCLFQRRQKWLAASSPSVLVSILIETKIVFCRGFYSHLRRI